MNPIPKIGQTRISNPFLSGLIYSFIWLGAAAVAMSLLLAFAGFQEGSLASYSYPVHALAVGLGGFVTGKRAGTKGWSNGGIMGMIYGILIAMISFLGFDTDFDMTMLWVMSISAVAGAFGGIFGVNAKK
jgi:putative membrane protein (TIGR04086 family)